MKHSFNLTHNIRRNRKPEPHVLITHADKKHIRIQPNYVVCDITCNSSMWLHPVLPMIYWLLPCCSYADAAVKFHRTVARTNCLYLDTGVQWAIPKHVFAHLVTFNLVDGWTRGRIRMAPAPHENGST